MGHAFCCVTPQVGSESFWLMQPRWWGGGSRGSLAKEGQSTRSPTPREEGGGRHRNQSRWRFVAQGTVRSHRNTRRRRPHGCLFGRLLVGRNSITILRCALLFLLPVQKNHFPRGCGCHLDSLTGWPALGTPTAPH